MDLDVHPRYQPAPPREEVISAYTQNTQFGPFLHTKERAQRVEDILGITQSGPQIVGLQEVFNNRYRGMLMKGLGQRHFNVPGEDKSKPSRGLVTASRYPIAAVTRHVFKRQSSRIKDGSWNPSWKKGFDLLGVTSPIGDLAIVNTHLASSACDDNPSSKDVSVRLYQLDEIVSVLEHFGNVVLMGDLNFTRMRDGEESREYHELVKEDFRDTLGGNNENEFRTHPPRHRLDYVFTRMRAQIHEVTPQLIHPSLGDHHGYEVKLRVTR